MRATMALKAARLHAKHQTNAGDRNACHEVLFSFTQGITDCFGQADREPSSRSNGTAPSKPSKQYLVKEEPVVSSKSPARTEAPRQSSVAGLSERLLGPSAPVDIDDDTDKHRQANIIVVEEGFETAVRVAIRYQPLLPQEQHRDHGNRQPKGRAQFGSMTD